MRPAWSVKATLASMERPVWKGSLSLYVIALLVTQGYSVKQVDYFIPFVFHYDYLFSVHFTLLNGLLTINAISHSIQS